MQGSGFWVRKESGEVVFVTNRHVVDIEYYDPKYLGRGYKVSWIKILTFKGAERFNNLISRADLELPKDRRVDIAILKNVRVINMEGSVTSSAIDVIADEDFLRTKLEWGDFVSFASFQPWRDSKSERPILRMGIVSSDPLYSYEYERIKRKEILLLEAFSFAGSSGSPVFANAKGIQTDESLIGGNFRPARIIGIAAGHMRTGNAGAMFHTGLSYCHRSDLLLRMMSGREPLETQQFKY